MAGLGVTLFADEHLSSRLISVLREHGYDAESCHEVGRANQSISDADQLSYTAQAGRALLTFNISDLSQLDSVWLL